MDQLETAPAPPKPEWALTRSERKRKALRDAGIEPRKFPWALIAGVSRSMSTSTSTSTTEIRTGLLSMKITFPAALAALVLTAVPVVAQSLSSAERNAFRQACEQDIRSLCSNVGHGNGQVIQCLQEKSDEVSEVCSAVIADLFPTPPAELPKQVLLSRDYHPE